MTRKWLAGTAMAALLSVGAAAQTTPQGQVPTGQTSLGSVNLPRAVMANGQPLQAAATRFASPPRQPSRPSQASRWSAGWSSFAAERS